MLFWELWTHKSCLHTEITKRAWFLNDFLLQFPFFFLFRGTKVSHSAIYNIIPQCHHKIWQSKIRSIISDKQYILKPLPFNLGRGVQIDIGHWETPSITITAFWKDNITEYVLGRSLKQQLKLKGTSRPAYTSPALKNINSYWLVFYLLSRLRILH